MGRIFGGKKKSATKSVSTGIPLARFIGPIISVGGIIAAFAMVLTGHVDLARFDLQNGAALQGNNTNAASIAPVSFPPMVQKSPDTVTLATFNIQDFGVDKASDKGVLSVLASVISRFDVVAIQEVASGDATPIHTVLEHLRAGGGQYASTVSEPVGRSGDMMSYAYVWDESRIQFVPQSAYVVHDSSDRMRFEPMVASFEARVGNADGRRPFRFTLINTHTSPDDVAASATENEMNVLDDVFVRVRQYDYETNGEEDCIMLGDLNVDTAGLRELGQIPNIKSIAGDTKTDTLQSVTLDHILIDQTMTREYTGRYGVFDLRSELGLSEEQALTVSDHLPLWAEFSAYEVPRFDAVAAGAGQVTH